MNSCYDPRFSESGKDVGIENPEKEKKKMPVGPPKKSAEQKAFERKCSEFGFKKEHYLKKAYVFIDSKDDFVEAELVGFTDSGKATFSWSDDEDFDVYEAERSRIENDPSVSDEDKRKLLKKLKVKERHVHVPIIEAAVELREYLEGFLDFMDENRMRNPKDVLRLKAEIREWDDFLEAHGHSRPGSSFSIDPNLVNLYGSFDSAGIRLASFG